MKFHYLEDPAKLLGFRDENNYPFQIAATLLQPKIILRRRSIVRGRCALRRRSIEERCFLRGRSIARGRGALRRRSIVLSRRVGRLRSAVLSIRVVRLRSILR